MDGRTSASSLFCFVLFLGPVLWIMYFIYFIQCILVASTYTDDFALSWIYLYVEETKDRQHDQQTVPATNQSDSLKHRQRVVSLTVAHKV